MTENQNTIEITNSAAERIKTLLASEPAGFNFRIRVDAGGCSGFQYIFGFGASEADDIAFEKNGIKVATDPSSIGLINGCVLDYVTELGAQYFSVKNPNATASCGCGTCFAV